MLALEHLKFHLFIRSLMSCDGAPIESCTSGHVCSKKKKKNCLCTPETVSLVLTFFFPNEQALLVHLYSFKGVFFFFFYVFGCVVHLQVFGTRVVTHVRVQKDPSQSAYFLFVKVKQKLLFSDNLVPMLW